MSLAIEAEALGKRFGSTVAVDGIDLAVPDGTVYGFLGSNRAGKTTTIRMLATLLRPTSGHGRVLGHDVVGEADEVRRLVRLTGQYASVDDDLTGQENLALIGRLLGLRRRAASDRARELVAAFGLEAAADRQVKSYSGGMRRRLDIAASLVVPPALLFLDEPTTGLDPRSRTQVWDVVRALGARGTTVLLTTQYLAEADLLADRLAVIDHGRVVAEGTTAEIKKSVGGGTVRVRLRDPARRDDAHRILTTAWDAPVVLDPDPATLSASVPDPIRAGAALSELPHVGIEVSEFSAGQVSLDEAFLALTTHSRSAAKEATA